MLDLRLRVRISQEELEQKIGKIVGDDDYNVLLTGPARVRKPDGRPLCVYLPGVMRRALDAPGVYEVLHSLRTQTTTNRGLASGTQRMQGNKRSYAKPVASAIVGAIEATGAQKYCRLTAWTGKNLPAWETLHPVLRGVARHFAEQVPDRFAAQKAAADATDPAWVVEGTPFTTITVNNTYPTGLHQDKGDLDEGFSTLMCLRRGRYTGGLLVLAEYRVAVDMQHGDLLLFDAHEWHGNTMIVCGCGKRLSGLCTECGAERISVVSYFRTNMIKCGSPEEEYQRANRYREKGGGTGLNRRRRAAAV